MKKTQHNKLSINRETLRTLVDKQLGYVAGGVRDRSDRCPPPAITETCFCNTQTQ